MRKMLLATATVLLMTGLVVAAEYTIGSYDKDTKTVTFKDADGKEVKAKITDKTKITRTDKEGKETDFPTENAEKMLSFVGKGGKGGGKGGKGGGMKADVTIEDGNITTMKMKGGFGGGKKKDDKKD